MIGFDLYCAPSSFSDLRRNTTTTPKSNYLHLHHHVYSLAMWITYTRQSAYVGKGMSETARFMWFKDDGLPYCTICCLQRTFTFKSDSYGWGVATQVRLRSSRDIALKAEFALTLVRFLLAMMILMYDGDVKRIYSFKFQVCALLHDEMHSIPCVDEGVRNTRTTSRRFVWKQNAVRFRVEHIWQSINPA